MPEKHMGQLRLLPVLLCMIFVWSTGVNGLVRVPIATNDEARTLIHIFGRSIDSPQTISATVESVVEDSPQHGPLYFILLNAWSQVSGGELFSLRLLSVFFALVTLAAVHRLAAVGGDANVAAAAVLILALNWLFLFYMRELRMYTLLPGLAAWNIWSYWRLSRPAATTTWHHWLSVVASTALILYLHYFGFFILAAVGAYHCIFARKDRLWLLVAAAYGIGGLLFVPWLPVVLEGHGELTLRGMTFVDSLQSILSLYSNDAWIIAAGLILVILWRRDHLNQNQRFLVILTFLTVAIILVANLVGSVLVPGRLRYLLALGPLLACSLAIGWSLLPKRPLLQTMLAVAWLAVFIAYANNDESFVAMKRKSVKSEHSPPFYSLIYNREIQIDESDAVLSMHPSVRITWITADYYQKRISSANMVHLHYNEHGSLIIQATRKQLDTLEQFVANYGSFWLVYNPRESNQESMGIIFSWVREYYRSCGKALEDSSAVIEYFVRDSDPC